MMQTPSGGDGPIRVVLGVGGGIAAYKACLLLRGMVEQGYEVRVVPTRAALEFVGAPTWAALSGQPVTTDVFSDAHEVPHVRLGQAADLVVVAPATADLLARAAVGQADDLLTSTLLTARCPVLMAPAMHTEMWTHPATRANVVTLRERGVLVLEPASGRLTGADSGPGRLPEPDELLACVRTVLARTVRARTEVGDGREVGGGRSGRDGSGDGQDVATSAFPQDLSGRRVLVTAGGTREPLDPVRYLGNRSSGRQGLALARAAALRGADVTLVLCNVALPAPTGMRVHQAETTRDLQEAVMAAAPGSDAIVMAAAPADFRPATYADYKIKKGEGGGLALTLVETPDILAGLVAARATGSLGPSAGPSAGPPDGPVVVGFAAETGDATAGVLEHGRAKLARKGADLLVVNDVGAEPVFGSEENAATILSRDGGSVAVPRGPKEALAHAVWDAVVARWALAREAPTDDGPDGARPSSAREATRAT